MKFKESNTNTNTLKKTADFNTDIANQIENENPINNDQKNEENEQNEVNNLKKEIGELTKFKVNEVSKFEEKITNLFLTLVSHIEISQLFVFKTLPDP